MRLRFVLAIAFAAAVAAVALARPWAHGSDGAAVIAQSSLRPTGFAILLRNDSADPLRIAQVTVNDSFVPFRAVRLVVSPHGRTRLNVDYAWIKGEPYEIGILTSTGAIVQSNVGGAEEA
jgi:hypothetical protein